MRKTNRSMVAAAAAGLFVLAGVSGCDSGGDLGALDPELGPSACTGDEANGAIATVEIDGKTREFEGLCIHGNVTSMRLMGKVPSITAVGTPAADQLTVELNPNRLTATATCDSIMAKNGMNGAGRVSFRTVAKGGKTVEVSSLPGGTFVVRSYSTVAGTHIAAAFDCPTTSGSISGSFNVRLE